MRYKHILFALGNVFHGLQCYLSDPSFNRGPGADSERDSASIVTTSANIDSIRPILSTLAVLGVALFALTNTARADDKDNAAPTNWWVYSNQTAGNVGATLQRLQEQTGQQVRISDVQVLAPNNFTVTYVQNTDSYGKQWWWWPNEDDRSLSEHLHNNNARLISLRAYDSGGGNIRYFAVMISNSGADGKEWWWGANDTADHITPLLQQRNARLTSLQSYRANGKTLYSYVMILNSGADGRAWWWWPNQSPQFIGNALTTNHATLVDLTPAGNGNFNVVMKACGQCPSQYWWFGQSGDGTLQNALRNNARISTVEAYPGCGIICYASVMTQGSVGDQHGKLLDWFHASQPLDLVWPTNSDGSDGTISDSGYDANGLALNPSWFTQMMADPTNSANNPNFATYCHFSSTEDKHGTCDSSQSPYFDFYDGPFGDFGICNQNDTVFNGHVSFNVATYTGKLYFDDWSHTHTGDDHDYNFSLFRNEYSGMMSNYDDEDDRPNISGSLPGKLHVEFNSDESLDQWSGTTWWDNFRWIAEGQKTSSFWSDDIFKVGANAVVTALVAVDGVHHHGFTELHPAFSLAVEDKPTIEVKGNDLHVTQFWHFFIRNRGTQGTCSHTIYTWRPSQGNPPDYYIQLPWAVIGDTRATAVAATGTAWTQITPATKWTIEFESGRWALLHFKLPIPGDSHSASEFKGDVSIEYSFAGGAKLASQMRALTEQTGAAYPVRTPVEIEEANWDQVLNRIADQANRKKLQSVLSTHSAVAPHPQPQLNSVMVRPTVLTITPMAVPPPEAAALKPEVTVDSNKESYNKDLKEAISPSPH